MANREQGGGEDAQHQHSQAVDREGDPRAGAGGQGFRGHRLVEVHELDDAQVVEGADDGEENADQGQPPEIDPHDGFEHQQLGHEADGGGYAGHGEHDEGHHGRVPGVSAVEPFEVVQIFGVEALAADNQQQTEGARRHGGVDDGVEHGRGIALSAAGQEAEKDEADVGDGGVGQHALDIALGDGDQIAQAHGQEGEDDEHALPVRVQPVQPVHQQPNREGKGGDLGGAAQEEGHGGGGALIDVRHPHVEGYGAELEPDADDQKDEPEYQYSVLCALLRRGPGHLRQLDGPGGPVDHGHAVEQHARAEGPEHEVFHGRFGPIGGVAVEGHQGIEA